MNEVRQLLLLLRSVLGMGRHSASGSKILAEEGVDRWICRVQWVKERTEE